jgi:DNA-binding PadR family transcriptional regulator
MLKKFDVEVLNYLRDADRPLYPIEIDIPTALGRHLNPYGRLYTLFGRSYGSIYVSLIRLETRGLIESFPGVNGRRLYRKIPFVRSDA